MWAIAAFRLDQRKSVHYGTANDIEQLKKILQHCLEKDKAQIVSIRKIEKREVSDEQVNQEN